ncbi:MAG: DUF4921 family protein [Patescibacteria group bacterium]
MSELRQDPVSGDWIILAPERAKRPHSLVEKKKPKRRPAPVSSCPFEPQNIVQPEIWPPILSYPNEKNWKVVIIPNKYPALRHFDGCATAIMHGPHSVKTGAGAHDLIVTRDHNKNFGELPFDEATRVLLILQERYRHLAKDPCNLYTSTFFNWGPTAGATVYHPHYQVLTLPIVPPDVAHSLHGSHRYFKQNGHCVHCNMLKFDLKEKSRIIDRNKYALSLTPFISRAPFEVRVFPLRHRSNFERTPSAEIKAVAAVLQSALKRMKKHLNDPDFNFFIHTAPLKDHKYRYYHWHVELIPQIKILGGFELSTGVDINVVDPEKAASILKGRK